MPYPCLVHAEACWTMQVLVKNVIGEGPMGFHPRKTDRLTSVSVAICSALALPSSALTDELTLSVVVLVLESKSFQDYGEVY